MEKSNRQLAAKKRSKEEKFGAKKRNLAGDMYLCVILLCRLKCYTKISVIETQTG